MSSAPIYRDHLDFFKENLQNTKVLLEHQTVSTWFCVNHSPVMIAAIEVDSVSPSFVYYLVIMLQVDTPAKLNPLKPNATQISNSFNQPSNRAFPEGTLESTT